MKDISRAEFEELVAKIGFSAIPEKFRTQVKNVALVIEDEPSEDVRKEFNLGKNESLLGLYKGVPRTGRGSDYGVGVPMPDCITLYRVPILEESAFTGISVETVVSETIWHEVAHYFGLDENAVRKREEEGGTIPPKFFHEVIT